MAAAGPTIEAVVKITERCNINCTYCYVFNKGDESYKTHDSVMKEDTVRALASFLLQGALDLKASRIQIDFHGGEPLLMKKSRFRAMCDIFISTFSGRVAHGFALMTNAMLVDEEWVQIFSDYKIGVGVSLDGPEAINDAERLDHAGRGTYVRVRKGLDILREARAIGRISGLGILTVSNPEKSAVEVYRHIVNDLDVNSIDVLLPIDSHASFDASQAPSYATIYKSLYDEWQSGSPDLVDFRIFTTAEAQLRWGDQNVKKVVDDVTGNYIILTVSSNGDVGPDDSLRTLNIGLFSQFNVRDHRLQEYLESPMTQAIVEAELTLPDDCIDCAWSNFCRGGAANGRLLNRYSPSRGFNNRSILCDSLQDIYSHIAASLIRRGVSYDQIEKSLMTDSGQRQGYEDRCPFATVEQDVPYSVEPNEP